MLTRMPSRFRAAHARWLRGRAMEYAAHRWPVAALAVPRSGRCQCERGDCVEPHLLDGVAIIDPVEAGKAWADHGWAVALVTSEFDVVDLPAAYGAALNYRLLARCPTAVAPRDRRWHFVMESGSVDAGLVTAAGGVLHSGPGDWIPTSPTRTGATGRVGWVVPPLQAHWRPYRRSDAIDTIFAGLTAQN